MISIRPFAASSAAAILILLHVFETTLSSCDRVVDALFLTPPSKVVPYPSLRLSTADRLGVPYSGIALDAGKAASLPGFALSLDAHFGTLSEATFTKLQNKYCAWSDTKSKVKWDEKQEYTLLDFLPPIMQAVSGKYFQSTRSK
eukprot:CAMPEP_0201942902 /NCGR_PEP_ID=MMETSP0903-20130614/49942_1 /ASSEMBLY_ACC=CAM_ASM_000552 /TAXON_ID=420261 /ORGANISM="Thalassiosira antarctica, Strain CCMP982" /LENGTH=143 /DNA_ID=CAMNT_0048485421 /DNA_START=83 /DNA_END=511 /DNA_ORIENTATION=-